MKNIKKFKKDRFYSGTRELTMEERIPLGLGSDTWQSLEDRAYQAAYDISEDWAKEDPDWNDVEEGFKKGVKEGIDFIKNVIQNRIDRYKKDPNKDILSIAERRYSLELILDRIDEAINDEYEYSDN